MFHKTHEKTGKEDEYMIFAEKEAPDHQAL